MVIISVQIYFRPLELNWTVNYFPFVESLKGNKDMNDSDMIFFLFHPLTEDRALRCLCVLLMDFRDIPNQKSFLVKVKLTSGELSVHLDSAFIFFNCESLVCCWFYRRRLQVNFVNFFDDDKLSLWSYDYFFFSTSLIIYCRNVTGFMTCATGYLIIW